MSQIERGEPVVLLLVEDNPAHAELVRRTLQGHQVANRLIHVSDGAAAIDYLFRRGDFMNRANSPQPHLILLDLRLPRVDGLDVLKTIKTTPHLQHLPVVILTTSRADEDVARAYAYHANSYLVKPVEFAAFTQMMRDLGFYWLLWNQDPLINSTDNV